MDALDVGVHVLVVDLFPPGPRDPYGMHGVIRQRLEQSDDPYDVPADTRYLVDGPASKLAQLYRRELAEHPYRRLASAGPYDLYRREPSG